MNGSSRGGLRITGTSILMWRLFWVILAMIVPPLAILWLFGTVLSPPARGQSIRFSLLRPVPVRF